MTIQPDTKNWTWVLERPCEECGFDAAGWFREDVEHAARTQGDVWTRLLADPRVRERLLADQWSALEYGCHVRDVFRLALFRMRLMLDEDEPRFPNWDQDETAVADRYAEQDPAVVTAELVEAAEGFADVLAEVGAAAAGTWERGGLRSDGARFTVESFARYLIHDPIHHVVDVERGYAVSGG